ncbi:MAG TPA: dihydrolipoamide dehydrogenase [Verrucomicrobia bacterium]|nr:dihydrolipoamide dehydrogenase [Verrucomicrobiota bacterium]
MDVIVIGSGGGTKIAIPAANRGLRVALIEEDAFGGTCLNRGCIPSKMLIYPAELAELVRGGDRLGISATVSLRFPEIMERIIRETEQTSAEVRQKHEQHPGITVYRGHARFVDDKTISVNGETLTADKIFIATGSRPEIPLIEGLQDTPYLTSREALRLSVLPRRMLVIGGGYIATELGGAFRAYGSDVLFLVRSRFLRGLDEDVVAEFERDFLKENRAYKPFTPERIRHDGELFHVVGRFRDGREETVAGDALLVAAGVVPETDRLGLEHTAIRRDANGFIVVNDRLETDVPGVYALGDCVGNYLFRHTVNYEGEYLMRTAFSKPPVHVLDYGPVPYAVFTTPQIAGVGLMEDDLTSRGIDYFIGKSTYADSTPGMARRSDVGFVKVLVDRATRRLLGAHIVGQEASVMIHLFLAMMKASGTLDDLMDMIFIHPALPEVARDAVRDAVRQGGMAR